MRIERITLKEALELVSFIFDEDDGWQVKDVKGDVKNSVHGDIWGDVESVKGDVDTVRGDVTYVEGNVGTVSGDVTYAEGNVGTVRGDVEDALGDVGYVWGNVRRSLKGTINDREWKFVETPKEKLQRLIKESGDFELLEAFNQMENN